MTKIMQLFLLFFVTMEVPEILGQTNSNRTEKSRPRSLNVYWNIPTFQCRPHKINFTNLAAKYNFIQNENDDFQGDKIAILYDPGNFPAIFTENGKTRYRNGGVPQEGNLTLHLNEFQKFVDTFIPNSEFAGIGIVDFESWRPIFRQNFGTLSGYRDLSTALEKKRHPVWPKKWFEKEATTRFETAGRNFMETTLNVAKFLRPNATWGYYAYPYCFNMSPNNMRRQCPKEVLAENDRLKWLFKLMDNFHPSLYLPEANMKENYKVQMIEGRMDESLRIMKSTKSKDASSVIPYFWYKYQDTRGFLTKDDLFRAFTVITSYPIKSLILWGSSKDVNSKKSCLELYDYIDNILGPLFNINY